MAGRLDPTGKEGRTIKGIHLARRIREVLEEKSGKDIVILDVRRFSGVTDYYVLVSGNSGPHLKAMFSEVELALRGEGIKCYRRSGKSESGWLILDFVDVILHIFLPERRSYYDLESLWVGAPRQV